MFLPKHLTIVWIILKFNFRPRAVSQAYILAIIGMHFMKSMNFTCYYFCSYKSTHAFDSLITDLIFCYKDYTEIFLIYCLKKADGPKSYEIIKKIQLKSPHNYFYKWVRTLKTSQTGMCSGGRNKEGKNKSWNLNLPSELLPFSFKLVFKFFFPLEISFTQNVKRWYQVIKMTYLMVSIKCLKYYHW